MKDETYYKNKCLKSYELTLKRLEQYQKLAPGTEFDFDLLFEHTFMKNKETNYKYQETIGQKN